MPSSNGNNNNRRAGSTVFICRSSPHDAPHAQQQYCGAAQARRHSSIVPAGPLPMPAYSSPFLRPVLRCSDLSALTAVNDSVFYETDDGYSDRTSSCSTHSTSSHSSPLAHRKVERSHSEPKGPDALFRQVPDDQQCSGAATRERLERYKTELCRAFLEAGHCKYGEKCQFAHGNRDLRSVNRHPKYKTEKCRSFHATGLCQYGARCHFVHHPSEAALADVRTAPSSASSSAAAAARARSVSLCSFSPAAVVPLLLNGQQTRPRHTLGSCAGDSQADFSSSYSSSPVSMSPGLNRSWPSEDGFFGSISDINSSYSSGLNTGFQLQDIEPVGPWFNTVNDLLLDIDE